MIINRSYERNEPTREIKLVYIFCEGAKREPQYFIQFGKTNARIKIKVIPADRQGNNSPMGLFDAAKNLFDTPDGPDFQLLDDDEVWFVVDVDKWKTNLARLSECAPNRKWNVCISNPCFEVWLHYHFADQPPQGNIQAWDSKAWKRHLNSLVKGGFDSRKHFTNYQTAIDNSVKNYSEFQSIPNLASTNVFKIFPSIIEESSAS